MPSSQSSNFGLKIMKMEKRRTMEKLLEKREFSRKFPNKNSDKNSPCKICKRSGHAEKNCWYRHMPQCNYCKKFGHVEKNCRNRNRHQANIAEEHDQEQCTFYATQDSIREK